MGQQEERALSCEAGLTSSMSTGDQLSLIELNTVTNANQNFFFIRITNEVTIFKT